MLYGMYREGRWGGHVWRKSRNCVAVVWVMTIGGGKKGMTDSCTHKNKSKHILYRPTHILQTHRQQTTDTWQQRGGTRPKAKMISAQHPTS